MGIYDAPTDAPADDLIICADEDVAHMLRLDRVVGKGGFAVVWKATFDGRLCACKVLQPRGGVPPPGPIVRLFVRECSSLMAMEHAAVIRCFGLIRLRKTAVPELGLPYDTYGMLLEFCEGGTLKDLLMAQILSMKDQYSMREALGWLAEVAAGLHQFHHLDLPVIHRDIKPDNVLLQFQEGWMPPPPSGRAAFRRNNSNQSNSGTSPRGPPRPPLEAKLADLGLGVRVGGDRSVLIRRRTTVLLPDDAVLPTSVEVEEDGDVLGQQAEAAAGAAGADADGPGAAALRGGGRKPSLGAQLAANNVLEGLPFMGFTTSPLVFNKRQFSNKRSARRQPERLAGVIVCTAPPSSTSPTAIIAAAAAAVAGAEANSPSAAAAAAAATAAAAASPNNLHKATLLNTLRVRMSGRRDSNGSVEGCPGVPLVGSHTGSPKSPLGQHLHAAAHQFGRTSGLSVHASEPSGPGSAGQLPPQALLPLPPTVGGRRSQGEGGLDGLSKLQVDGAEDPGSPLLGQRRSSTAAPGPASTNSCGSDGGAGAAKTASNGGPSFTAFPLPSGWANMHSSETEVLDSGQLATPFMMGPGGSGHGPALGQSYSFPRESDPPAFAIVGSGAGVGAGAGGHGGGHGGGPLLPPISERSLSADDTPSNSGHGSSGSNVYALNNLLTVGSMNRTAVRNPLYTIQEPNDDASAQQQAAVAAAAAAAQHTKQNSLLAGFRNTIFGGNHPQQQQHQQQQQPTNGEKARTEDAQDAADAADGGLLVGGSVAPMTSVPLAPVSSATTTGTATGTTTTGTNSSTGPLTVASMGRSPSMPVHPLALGPSASTHTTAHTHNSALASHHTAGLLHLGSMRTTPASGAGLTPQLLLTTTMSRGSRATGGGGYGPGGLTLPAGSLPRSETLTSNASGTTRLSKRQGSLGLRTASSMVRPNLRQLKHSDSIGRAMRRVESLLRSFNKASLPKFGRESQYQWVFALTGQAGSCMYMAPEVFRAEPYNEKVDVFSFGIMMYELLARELLLVKYIGGTRAGLEMEVTNPQQYATKVCQGFRPPRSPRIPDAQWQLIEACWHPDPVVRPDMMDVRLQLEAAIQHWDCHNPAPTPAISRSMRPQSRVSGDGAANDGEAGTEEDAGGGCRCIMC